MPRNKETTDRQKKFLLAFRNPAGPLPDDWPAPSILRRWLRHRGFRAALESIQQTLRRQADFHLTAAATKAAISFASDQQTPRSAKELAELLRLSHVRQRFEVTAPLNPKADHDEEDEDDRRKPRRISREDVRANLHLVWFGHRLTDEEFNVLAHNRNWIPPIEHSAQYPAPEPQDTLYFKLIASPHKLLHWMWAYTKSTGDKRYQHILELCKGHFVPDKPPFVPAPAKSLDSPPADPP